MKLKDYLNSNNITQAAFAEMLGVNEVLVHRAAIKNIKPRDRVMLKIYLATKGKVTPNDFYNLPIFNKQKKRGQKLSTN